MLTLFVLTVTSAFLALLFTPVLRRVFTRLGVVDRPDQFRKLHHRAVPKLGGVAIALAYVLPFVLLLQSNFSTRRIVLDNLDQILRLFPAALVVFLTGVLDDVIDLRPRHKLMGQVLGASLAWWAGVHISGFSGVVLEPWLSLPLTVGWLVLCTNAFNLIDGVDGLATGVGLVSALTILLSALLQENLALALAVAPLAGALLGFLRYNFNPASVFLGDSGSLLVGFLLGAYGVLWTQKTTTMVGMTAPLMVMAVPLFDTGIAVVRRFLRNKPIFGADRDHVHHRLLALGFSHRGVAFVLYAACGIASVCSLLVSAFQQDYAAVVILLFCGSIGFGLYLLDYPELAALRRVLGGDLQRIVAGHVSLRQLDRDLQDAATSSECWRVICRHAEAWGFCGVRMRLAGRTQEESFCRASEATWSIRIPLSASDYINLEHPAQTPVRDGAIPHVIDLVQNRMRMHASAAIGQTMAGIGNQR